MRYLIRFWHLLIFCLSFTFFASIALLPCGAEAIEPQVKLDLVVRLANRSSVFVLPNADFTYDDKYTYVLLRGTVYRTSKKISRKSKFRAVLYNPTAESLEVIQRKLFVVGGGRIFFEDPTNYNTLLVSSDRGRTFKPQDSDFLSCTLGECQYLHAKQLKAVNGRLFLNAGSGNLLVSLDFGKRWQFLYGGLNPLECTHESYEIIGNSLLIGGECPLDYAFLAKGQLDTTLTQLVTPRKDFSPIVVPGLENRNIMIIETHPSTSIVYAGAEGALLRSKNSGDSFDYSLRFDSSIGSTKYPYFNKIFFSSRYPNVVIAAGFDKQVRPAAPFMAISYDNGHSWIDVSSFVIQRLKRSEGSISFIKEEYNGRIMVGLLSDKRRELTIGELKFKGLGR